MIQNKNIENPSQKLNLLSNNMFDYIVRLLVWAVGRGEGGGAKVLLHPIYAPLSYLAPMIATRLPGFTTPVTETNKITSQ